jgi:hypothetical protein
VLTRGTTASRSYSTKDYLSAYSQSQSESENSDDIDT